MDKIAFGRKLFYARKAKNMTTNQLAEQLGLSGSYLRQIECGNRKPSVDLLIQLCNELDISPEFLLMENLEKNTPPKLIQVEAKLRKLSDTELRMCDYFVEAMQKEKENKKKKKETPV